MSLALNLLVDASLESGLNAALQRATLQRYYDSRTFMDINIEYALAEHFTLFANARNVLDRPHDLLRYSNEMPGYSRLARSETFAVQWTLGVMGTF